MCFNKLIFHSHKIAVHGPNSLLILVSPSPVLIIMVWDAYCLLWANFVNLPMPMEKMLEEQKLYLTQQIEQLIQMVKTKVGKLFWLRTINLSYTMNKEGKVNNFMFRASVCYSPLNQQVVRQEIPDMNAQLRMK